MYLIDLTNPSICLDFSRTRFCYLQQLPSSQIWIGRTHPRPSRHLASPDLDLWLCIIYGNLIPPGYGFKVFHLKLTCWELNLYMHILMVS